MIFHKSLDTSRKQRASISSMSIGTISYPAMPNGEERAVSKSTPFDSRDIVIYCLSGVIVLLVIALVVILANR